MRTKLDLHNISHADVPKKIDEFIARHHNEKSLEIITGNSETMKRIVIETVQEYNYEYEVGDFLGINTGYIKIF